MKHGKYVVIALVAFFGIFCSGASAMTKTDFSIMTNSSWLQDSMHPAEKLFSSNSSGVEWTYSNKSSHKMWFRVQDASGNTKGSGLLNYKTTGAFSTYLTVGSNVNYTLGAKREHFIDPLTTVSGKWLP